MDAKDDKVIALFFINKILSQVKRFTSILGPVKRIRECLPPEQSEAFLDESVRASVVLLHATFEDFMRELCRIMSKGLDERLLIKIPQEKISLVSLAQHRGKTVEDLIFDSVSSYLDRKSLSSLNDLSYFIELLGQVPQDFEIYFPVLDRLIKRRHQIVHRADLPGIVERPEIIELAELKLWLSATQGFSMDLVSSVFSGCIDGENSQKIIVVKATFVKLLAETKGTSE